MSKKAVTDRVFKVRIPADLMEEVNDFRHEHRLDSRTEAVIILLRRGLDNANSSAPVTGMANERSHDEAGTPYLPPGNSSL